MTDTPETDGIEFKALPGMMPPYNTVPAEFARRLERERDESRKDAAMCKSNHDEIIPELIRRREAKDRSREIIARLASKAKEEQP